MTTEQVFALGTSEVWTRGTVNIEWGSVNFWSVKLNSVPNIPACVFTVRPCCVYGRVGGRISGHFFICNIMKKRFHSDIVLVTAGWPGYCVTCVLLCHRAVRCPCLTRESPPGSSVSVELTCPLRPRYSLTTHTHTDAGTFTAGT